MDLQAVQAARDARLLPAGAPNGEATVIADTSLRAEFLHSLDPLPSTEVLETDRRNRLKLPVK